MKKLSMITVLILSIFASAVYAAPWVKGYPKTLVDKTSQVTVLWDSPGAPHTAYPATCTAKVVFGVSPQNYTGSIDQTGAGVAQFTPNSSGMTGGVYYCRVSDTASNEVSLEFIIHVASSDGVTYVSPPNGSSSGTTTPQLQWNPVPGVPYYTVLVFDSAVTIDMGGGGSISITANVIWAATTDQTHLDYGSPDPSGYFTELSAPPLMQGLTYAWLVLANYDGTPAMIASNVIPLPWNFTVSPAAACGAPILSTPADSAVLSSPLQGFTWSAPAGTPPNNYKFVLLKKESGGSDIGFGSSSTPLWSGNTNQTNIDIPANIALNHADYEWYVIALDATGKGSKSQVRGFHYNPAVADTSVNIYVKENIPSPLGVTSVPNAIVFVDTSGGGSVNVYPMVCGNDGGFFYDMQPASYDFSIKKAGFQNAVYNRAVSGVSFNDVLILTRCAYVISGKIIDNTGNTVNGARVKTTQGLDSYETDTLTDGSFKLYVPASGSWGIEAAKTGFQTAAVSRVLAPTDFEYDAGTITINKNVNTLTGTVSNQLGQGIASVLVTVYENGNPSNSYSVSTDSSGGYIIYLSDATWIINAVKDGFVSPPSASAPLSGGSSAVRNFTMPAAADQISGYVTDSLSNYMAGVIVRAMPSGGGPAIETVTDGFGNYTLSVSGGTYNVSAVETGYTSSVQNVVFALSPGGLQQNNVNLVLTSGAPPSNASVQVHVASGPAIAGANVMISGTDNPGNIGSTASGITDASGNVTLSSLVPGNYNLTVSKIGYNAYSSATPALAGGVNPVINVNLTANASTGTISGSTGAGSATVEIYDQANPATPLYTYASNGAGNYTSIAIPYGNYMVKAYKLGYSSSPAQVYLTLSSASATANFVLAAASGGAITVTGPSDPIYNENIGGPYQFTAAYIDGGGNNIYTPFTWSAQPVSAGAVSASGVFTPTNDYIGPVKIVASAMDLSGSFSGLIYQKLNPGYAARTVQDYEGFKLEIPAGAASASNTVDRITLIRNELSRARSSTQTKSVLGKVYQLTDGFLFNTSVALTLPIPAGYSPATASIGVWDDTNNTWTDLGGAKGDTDVRASINHFSEYALLTDLESLGLTYVNLTPNPFTPTRGPISISYIANSKEGSSVRTTVKIYNMADKLIRTLVDGQLRSVGTISTETWNGRDNRNRPCLNGRYLLQIEVEDTKGKKQYIRSIALIK